MIALKKGQIFWRQGVEWEVVRRVDSGDPGSPEAEIIVANQISGMTERRTELELLSEYAAGVLKVCQDKFLGLKREPQSEVVTAPPPDASQAGAEETRRRVDYITRLVREGAFGINRKALAESILRISIERGERRPPHVSTVYRWHGQFRQGWLQVHSLVVRFSARGGRGRGRLHPEVEAIILEKIDEVFLAQKTCSAETLHNAVCLEIKRYNQSKVVSQHLKDPGLRTVQRRLQSLCAYELAVARFGEREAERRFAKNLGARRVTRILELVEIDHSPLDCLAVDEEGVVVGRPWITVVLDRHSRCVLGFHLSLAGHGTEAVFEGLRYALMPKTYLKGEYADQKLDWPCFGWPERLVMDNGREFHGESVVQALIDIGVIAEYAASRDPNDKPHVERFIKTLNYCFIHRLPGTTLAKVHQRIGFKSEEQACFTLKGLDKAIHQWVCNVYHLRPNGGLNGRMPLRVWQESAQAHPPQLKMNAGDLEIVFSRSAQSKIQNDGIDLNTFKFVSADLLHLRAMLPEKSKVDVRWPWHDAGHIWVWDPASRKYLKIPNKDETLAGLTVDQAKAAIKALADPASEYRQVRAGAEDVVRGMARDAQRDQQLKKRKQGARFANMTSKDSREAKPDTSPAQTAPVPEWQPSEGAEGTEFEYEVTDGEATR
jgi:putative transposase